MIKKLKNCFTLLFSVGIFSFLPIQNVEAQGCNPLQPYDQIQSGFHTTVAIRPDGTFQIWGSGATANGNGGTSNNHLTPVTIEPNGAADRNYSYTGTPLFATLATNSTTAMQGFILTTNGLYSWGGNNVAVSTSLDNLTGFQQILLPNGVNPSDVKELIATFGALAILTNNGNVWISARDASFHGNGGTTPGAGDNYWALVRRSSGGNPVLNNVEDIRVSPTGIFAITSTGQWYTWGPRCYIGDGTAVQTLNYATPMTTPFAGKPVMIALTSDFTNATFTNANNRTSYFAINPVDRKIYALGGNGNGQLGQGNTTISTGWVPVRNSDNSADLDNINFISGNDQDGWTTASAAISAITTDGKLWAWGSNNGMMIGGASSGTNYTFPIIPGGFNPISDTATYVEVGGHTLALMKKCAPKYCYVGHKINGSMGDGVNAGSNINTFDCANTPDGLICGVSTYDGGDAPLTFENGSPAQHYYICERELFLGDIAADADNGQNNNVAWGADNTGTNGDGLDEDGLDMVSLSYNSSLSPNFSAPLTVVHTDPNLGPAGAPGIAKIYAWVDWNGNGKFEASEAFTTTLGAHPDPQTVNLTWNNVTSSCGNKYMRVRITGYELTDNPATTNIDERSIGMALHGEVEDFYVDVDILADPTGDCDGDGISNAQEVLDGTDPADPCSFILASQSLTPDADWIAGDCDGDGVTNGQEVTDGTDPLNPCQYNTANISLPQTGAWLTADCDGDGVTNGDEVTDGTDPSNPCSFVLGSQSVMPSVAWNNADCDQDGVTNGTEVTNGTDPLNSCEYVLANQVLANVGALWNAEDCDGDGVTNGQEVTDGTNPNNPCSYNAVNQNLANVTSAWTNADCDGDGVTNGDEINPTNPGDNPTDPLNPCDYNAGDITLIVTATNCPPVANGDSATTDEDTPVVINVVSNDTDADGNLDITSVTVVTPPSNGTTTVDPVTGEITYTPNPNFNGNDTLIYSICDTGMPVYCDTAVVIITVTPVNDAPSITNETVSTDENTPITVDVTSNDSDIDGDDLTVTTIVNGGSNGTTTIYNGDSIVYTPNPNFNGLDTVVVTVCDNGTPQLCMNDTIFITVVPCLSDPLKDCDGDGVTNGQEVADGTDPSNPCDYNVSSQVIANVGTLWNNADCDEDGVTNGQEVIDGTNPNDPCDYDITSQVLANVGATWNNADCDGDGVTNGDEITDGTNPSDPCDLIVANQSVTPSTAWTNGDCDEDGVTNGQEVTDNTDINNPCDYNVSNQIIANAGALWNNADCDEDGVTNGQEVIDGTNPNDPCDYEVASQVLANVGATWNNADCDGDGVINSDEITDGTNPLDPCDLVVASQSVTPSTAWTNGDCDEDGVTNGQEVTDNTDINDPCDYNVSNQVITNVGTAWNNADCDGDGVTNGDEVTDGTDPNNPCDYLTSSITLTQGGAWNNADCDGDGVTNGDEITDGTDPNDACDLIVASQSVTPSTAWINGDCDEDGVTNGQEVTDNTDINDPCDYNVSNQVIANVGTLWNNEDCDEDGVTNGQEVTDGTNPNDPCDYNVANQVIANVGATWNNADCDGDGVINGDEITDGTNPLDPCDLIVASQSVTPSTTWTNGDCDGDGVTNGDEMTDNTDINDPCDYNVSSQVIANVSTAWNTLDCDGDGVTNEDEIADGTNPNDPCDYTLTSVTLTQGGAWNNADCDGDGVINGDEVTDGTNPNDPCDLVVANQSVTPSTAWTNGDCDEDGVTNGDEVTDGTDPNNPCDYEVTSQVLSNVGALWNTADCDGDGVTNGDEVADGTDPNNPCDYLNSSITLTQGGVWNNADCDGDGVTNGDEVTDGTNPNDPCDFVLTSQTVTPSTAWNNADCDGDGISNGDEVTEGSNPLDPCDPKTCGVDATNAFTPDGDGINDVWVIKGIENYPNNELTVYNRWGNVVFSADGYLNTWDGTSNSKLNVGGEELPTGTYYYVIDTKDETVGVLKGYVYIQR